MFPRLAGQTDLDPAALRVPDAANAAARRQARRARGGAGRRVRERGRRRVLRQDDAAVHQRARRPARGVGRPPRSRAPRRLRRGSALHPHDQGRARGLSRAGDAGGRAGRGPGRHRGDAPGSRRAVFGREVGARSGVEPYEGADADARAVDTRRGEPGPIAITHRSGAAGALSRRDAEESRDPVPGRAHEGADVVGRDRRGGARSSTRCSRRAAGWPKAFASSRHRLRRGRRQAVRQDGAAAARAGAGARRGRARFGIADHRRGLRIRVRFRQAVRPRRRHADACHRPGGAPQRSDVQAGREMARRRAAV